MRFQALCTRPKAEIVGIEGKRSIDPCKRFYQPLMLLIPVEAAPRNVLHQPMHQKVRTLGVARHERVGSQVGESLALVLIISTRRRLIKEEFGHRLGRKEREAFE